MCCRCVMVKTLAEVIDWAEIEELIIDIDDLKPNYNIAPTQRLPVLASLDGHLTLTLMTWALPPQTDSKARSVTGRGREATPIIATCSQ